MMTDALWGLPDPDLHREFYADVPGKRLLAFVVDSIVIVILTLVLVPFTAFTAIFYLGFLMFMVGFVYRTASIAALSATPGMWLFSIELRNRSGARLNLMEAFLHTTGFTISMSMVLPQVISIILMVTTPRGQGLTDLVLGTAAINRAASRV